MGGITVPSNVEMPAVAASPGRPLLYHAGAYHSLADDRAGMPDGDRV